MGKKMEEVYAQCCQKIADKSKELDHKDGYRFLLCSKRLFDEKTKILFLGLNPGVDKNDVTKIYSHESCEHGCAFFSEEWDGNPRGTQHLQVQVINMLEALKNELRERKSTEIFANEDVLSAYFIPFRSSELEKLANKKSIYQFAIQLWGDILKVWKPEMIITLGKVPFEKVRDTLIKDGYTLIPTAPFPSGWKGQTLEVVQLRKGTDIINLGRMLHLSHFKIFSRDECREPIRQFMELLCNRK